MSLLSINQSFQYNPEEPKDQIMNNSNNPLI